MGGQSWQDSNARMCLCSANNTRWYFILTFFYNKLSLIFELSLFLFLKGVSHGLHIFIVPIRDPYTMRSMPGVIVGDMGPKIGLNGVDNGFATFNNVRVPSENLLNKTGDVTPEGVYITPFKVKKHYS
jgi:hypothetical protein